MTLHHAGPMIAIGPDEGPRMETKVPASPAPDPLAVHRALASSVRVRIMDTLVECSPRDIQQLSASTGLHPNTVRSHLAVLEKAALVTLTDASPAGRGRPRRLYRAVVDSQSGDAGADGYELLAAILAEVVAAESIHGFGDAEQRAADWGRRLVHSGQRSAGAVASTARALDLVMVMLDRLGFQPEVDIASHGGPVLRLHQCPFQSVVRQNPKVACAVHFGLTRGALEALDCELEIRRFEPHLGSSPCVTVFDVRRAAPGVDVAGEVG